jgi:hypothetical protein
MAGNIGLVMRVPGFITTMTSPIGNATDLPKGCKLPLGK